MNQACLLLLATASFALADPATTCLADNRPASDWQSQGYPIGNVIVDLTWKGGKLSSATPVSPIAQSIEVRIPGDLAVRSIKLWSNETQTLHPAP